MANNYKQCFNAHYQPHCHPTTKSLRLCSSVYCGPPHPSRRIMVGGRSRQPKSCRSSWLESQIINKIEEKSTKSSQSFSKVVGLRLADQWVFPTLVLTSFTQNILDSASKGLTHIVQGLEYLEARWVNVMAGDALDPCIARSSTAMILIIQIGILMWSLRVNLDNRWLSSVWPQLTHCCLTDVAVILNIKLSNMFLWMISLVFPLNFAIRWMPLDLIDDK